MKWDQHEMGRAWNGTLGHEMGLTWNGTDLKWPDMIWPTWFGPTWNGRAWNGIYPSSRPISLFSGKIIFFEADICHKYERQKFKVWSKYADVFILIIFRTIKSYFNMLLIFLCKFFMIIFGLGSIPFFLLHFVVAIKGGGRFKGKSKFLKHNFLPN